MALTGSGVLVSQQLAATETTQYTAPSTVGGNPLKTVTIKGATLTNTGPATAVSLSLVKSGGTADGTHRVLSGYPLGVGDSTVVAELVGHFLGPGDFVSAITSALVQTVTVTGGAGTFTLTSGTTTTAVAFNATAATLQAALQALAALGTSVTVTGSAGGPYTVTILQGATLVPLLTGAGSGGASVAIAAAASTVDLVVSGAVLS